MQITGEICKFCEHPVLAEVDAAVCPHCQGIIHKSCLESLCWSCPHCGGTWDEELATASTEGGLPADSPLRFVTGEWQRPRTSWLYRISLVVVAGVMVLLLAAYLGLVAWVAYQAAAHGIFFWKNAQHSPPTGGFDTFFLGLFFLVYAAGSLALIFLLIKPLLAPRTKNTEAFSLEHADAPQLFALVGWICRSLDAPIPSRIDVDCSVNAQAKFQSGWRGLFSNEVALVFGLPLAAGMSLKQFAGILAHEYGHFSQGSRMRASYLMYLIREINSWFYRAVNERDDWDAALAKAAARYDQAALMAALCGLAQFGVWATRRVLWVLMMTGHACGCFMSRQMEYDADRYQFTLCGSDCLAPIMQRMRQLHLGSSAAMKQVRERWVKEKKLFDRMPEYIVSRANEISAEAQDKFLTALSRRRTGIFDWHPADAQRIERAVLAKEPGVFHPEGAATSLFANFPELSRRMTLSCYQTILGPQVKPEFLINTSEAQSRTEHNYAADREKVARYFQGYVARLPAVKEERVLIVRQNDDLPERIRDAARQMIVKAGAARGAGMRHERAEMKRLRAGQAAQLLQAGFQFEPARFGLGQEEPERAQVEAWKASQAALPLVEAFEALGVGRLLNTVQWLSTPQAARKIREAEEWHAAAREILWMLSRLADLLAPLRDLGADCATLELLLEYRRNQPSADNAAAALETVATGIQERVNALQEATAQLRYPFEHAAGAVMVSEYARNKEYHADPLELALREGRSHAEKLPNLYVRLLGNLVLVCEEVERNLNAGHREAHDEKRN